MWEGIRRVKRFFEPPQEKSVFEQQKEVIDAAAEWDTLTAFPAWTKALRHLAEEVNATLIEATKHEANPAEMMWHVVRWNGPDWACRSPSFPDPHQAGPRSRARSAPDSEGCL